MVKKLLFFYNVGVAFGDKFVDGFGGVKVVEAWSGADLLVVVVDFGEEIDLFEGDEFVSVLYSLEGFVGWYDEEEGYVWGYYFVF